MGVVNTIQRLPDGLLPAGADLLVFPRLAVTVKRRGLSAKDRLIDNIFRRHTAGMPIGVVQVRLLFPMVQKVLHQGATHDTIGAAMVAFLLKNG